MMANLRVPAVLTVCIALIAASTAPVGARADEAAGELQRVTTVVPFPRGLAVIDGELHVLARGRVRGAGGVTAEIDDRAGTLFVVDANVAEPVDGEPGEAVRGNGRVLAEPTDPPFRLWDRSSTPPESDRRTDRPYCVLRYHAPTQSFYICAFSGIDMPRRSGRRSFSKNLTDAILRYDLRTRRWHEIERHNLLAGGTYPHHDPQYHEPPHGWLNGPDNLLPLGRWLYAVAKDNSVLIRYDLAELADDPEAVHPPSHYVLGNEIWVDGRPQRVYGHSGLAYHDGWLYIATRTSGVIFRVRLDDEFVPVEPIAAQIVARFDPYDPATGETADVTDLAFDDAGRLYVISARPARVNRFTPSGERVFDARDGRETPWADLAARTDNPRMKSENLLYHDGWLYVTSGDGYGYQAGAEGTVYRVRVTD